MQLEMEEREEENLGPFSVFKRKPRRSSEKRSSRKLRSMLGEVDGFGDEDRESVDSRCSNSDCSSQVSTNTIRCVGENLETCVAGRLSVGDLPGNEKPYFNTNKRNQCCAEDVGDVEFGQKQGEAIVHEECRRIEELTKRIDGMNDTVKKDKNASDLHCQTDGEGLDSAQKITAGNNESRASQDVLGCCPSSCESAKNERRRSGKDGKIVKRKHNLYYCEAEVVRSSSQSHGPTTLSNPDAIKPTAIMSNDLNGNTRVDNTQNDGLLSRFGQRHSSGTTKKRHLSSTGSDFERKMGSPMSSRSSSVRSQASSVPTSIDSGLRMGFQEPHSSVVVVAIDFGTTFSGYAFAFTRDPDSIHMMRKWEGGDPGVNNQKIPTTLLLKPDGSFHSFGYGARDFYHDLEHSEAKKWLFFEKFKMSLHSSEDLNPAVMIKAANGMPFPAWKVFAHALRFFKEHVLTELSDQSTARIFEEDITWVLTVPAIWRQPAKQFMRTAAHEAGIASWDCPERLLIALEPEAASIFCRKMRIRDCIIEDDLRQRSQNDSLISEDFEGTTQYVVVDCGGGTVDLTVHELDVNNGTLRELHRGTGGACGATGIDAEFENLMKRIFDGDFIDLFKKKRPAGWVDLIIAFESKKRTARPGSQTALNISLPYSFIDYYRKKRRSTVENAIKKLKNPDIKWSQQGMLRIAPSVMEELFQPVLDQILSHIRDILQIPELVNIKHLFLVGGFSESPLLQQAVRDECRDRVRIVIPHDVGLTILKGAVQFGLDPTVVRVRRSALTYGVGVLNKFNPDKHEETKRVVKDGVAWCKDILDKFVSIDDSVGLGDAVTRSYAPARAGQKSTVINIYCSERKENLYTTDKTVRRCGQIRIEMPDLTIDEIPEDKRNRPRELQATMLFGDTELKVTALDVLTGKSAKSVVDFLNY